MAIAARQRKADKLDEKPHSQETSLIEQCIAFCKSLVGEKAAEVKEEKKEITHGNLDGVEVLAKKEDRADEYYFVPTASKKKGKSKGPAKAEGSSKPIKHNAETFNLFSKLKLDAPITTADIPPLIEKLEGQLEGYKQKIKEHEEKREEMKRKILAGEEEEEEAKEEGEAKADE